MLNKAVVVGVDEVKSWTPHDTVAAVLGKLGENSGNIIFTKALSQAFEKPTTTSFSIPDNALEGRDAIVIAAANWINEFDDFSWLANRIEQTNLPVFLIGVGAQAGLDHEIPKVNPGTLRLLKIVSERSKTIAARGVYTCEVLEKYGITNVVPTGCPSMLLAGRNGPAFTQEATFDNVVLHGTRHGFSPASSFQNWLYREGMSNDWELLLQSEHADIYYALGKTNNAQIMARSKPIVQDVYGMPDDKAIADYLRRRGLFFTNFASWITYMRTRSFCVGSRIHGTVASILAGTPAVLIAHDSRTLELAQTMGIPHLVASEMTQDQPLPKEKLLETYEAGKAFAGYKTYFDQYMNVFLENDLNINKNISLELAMTS